MILQVVPSSQVFGCKACSQQPTFGDLSQPKEQMAHFHLDKTGLFNQAIMAERVSYPP